jgi:hypothetical protein
VELRGLEPLTPCMPCRCATSCATAPDFAALAESRRSNLISLMHFRPVRQSAPLGVSPVSRVSLAPSHNPRLGTGWVPTEPETKNPPESNDSGGLSVELRGLEPLTPCMPCRCATSCATAPNYCCSASFSPGFPRSNSNILEQQFRKFQIGHIPRDSPVVTPLRRQREPSPRCRRPAAGPPPGSPSRGARGHRRRGLLRAGRG